ncbi:hypothetical protein B7C42_03447 [Nocardia cerradoensis]|uniref:Lipoprotein LppU n=1 Tax=Nocardia cerradoensis TaxID=85688 RepID=A0A231H6K0_9NOCA|nr:hypothetical protein [Nocardia cerradoensis]OXR44653.1 hypothetical protein B7C42_03447 [Nocardia cerradoensis]
MKFAGPRPVKGLVLALMAVAALTVTGCSMFSDAAKSDTARAKVGDCINVLEGSPADSKTEPVDCSSAKAVYTVKSTSDKKQDCGTEYSSYEETFNGGTTAFLCLAPNLKQGNCYHEDKTTGYSYAECDSAEATVKVVKRVDGQNDEFLCDANSTFLTLSEPKTTFCLANPES